MRSGLRLAGWAAVVLLVAGTGCQATLAAGVDVRPDGSGTVGAGLGLDAAALREVGDLAAVLRVDDLRQAGWEVEGPKPEDDGLTWVRASKSFADPPEAERAMAQLSGPDGPFRDFRLTRAGSLLRIRTGFTGTVDLTRGLAGLVDPDLLERLGGDPGLDALTSALRVEVAADLPGKIRSNAPTTAGGRAVWTPEMGSQLTLQADADLRRLAPIVYGTLAVAGAVAALAVVVVRRRR
ncbi:MAG: hypothetical protein M3O23_02025 [Actinomycetota bacterium]|nr:hypothetical protein [Actinomycetota bacterium]